MTRRRWTAAWIVMGGVGAALLSFPVPSTAAGETVLPKPLCFEVRHDGKEIGRHRIRFSRHGDLTKVAIAIDLRVSLGPFTLFSYRHRNLEVWSGDRLVAIDTRTDDDGERFSVSGRQAPDGFVVEGAGGRLTLPADVVPTSYWREDAMRRAHWLDTQRGVPIQLSVQRRDATAASSQVYDLSGDLDLSAGYDEEGRWHSLAFEARGAKVEYRPCDPEETRARWAFALEDGVPAEAHLDTGHD